MTLFQENGSDPRVAAAHFADVLAFYGAIGDAACGNPPGFALRKAAAAMSLAEFAQLEADERDAICFAGLLHAVGALGNPAYRKGEQLSERLARMEGWDVPAQGARVCAELPGLPAKTADFVRWQAECWDGTGYPDQLRWHGIPKAAVLLSMADAFAGAADPEEALASVSLASGRAYGPESARAFVMWFHTTGGEVDPIAVPIEALDADAAAALALFESLADRIDAHNDVPGRWQRIARLCEATAGILHLDEGDRRALAIAARIYGAGEIGDNGTVEASFDPLARLGIDERAAHAAAAGDFVTANPTLGAAAPVLQARGEWFDGTGKPDGLLHQAIPVAAGILAAAIAYDALDHKDRIDTAGGTQFDPRIVRAILEAARAGVT